MFRVCVVHKPRQFNEMLDNVLLPAASALAQRIGGELIREDEMREEDGIARVEALL